MAHRNAIGVVWVALPVLALAQAVAREAPVPTSTAESAAPGADPAPPAGAAPVRSLEERVAELRDRVQRTRAAELAETQGGAGTSLQAVGVRTVIVHQNEFGASHWLESATYTVDGAAVYTKTDLEGDLSGRRSFEVFDARVTPGAHRIAVELVYRGEGFGPAGEPEGGRLTLRGSHAFYVTSRGATITAIACERSSAADPEPHPAIHFDIAPRIEAASPAAR